MEVDVVDKPAESLELEEVFRGRRLLKVPLSRYEYFLLEYRRASGSYYNRNIPRDGLLLWHIDEQADNDEERHKRVDLVCADGLFSDRGAPSTQPDMLSGRDNLDFWSRDTAYADAHNGNQETRATCLMGFATGVLRGIQTLRCGYTGATRGIDLSVVGKHAHGWR